MGKRQAIVGWLALTLSIFSTLMAADIEISAKARKKGMEQAPALIQASGINCTLNEARLIESGSRRSSFAGTTLSMTSGGDSGGGSGGSPPPSGGGGGEGGGVGGGGGVGMPEPSSSATQYEVACNEGLGYVISTVKGKTPEATLCLELEDLGGAPGGSQTGGPASGMSAAPPGGMGAGPPQGNQSKCLLPGNANQVAGMTAFIIKAGLQCLPTKARGLGHTAKNALFEVACDDNTGYVIATSLSPDANKEVRASDCGSLPATSNIHCTLTDPKAALMVADQLMAKSGVACNVTDRRMFGNNATGDKFYEVACAEGSGYVVQQTFSGEFGQTITCADIGTTAGGCQLAGNKK